MDGNSAYFDARNPNFRPISHASDFNHRNSQLEANSNQQQPVTIERKFRDQNQFKWNSLMNTSNSDCQSQQSNQGSVINANNNDYPQYTQQQPHIINLGPLSNYLNRQNQNSFGNPWQTSCLRKQSQCPCKPVLPCRCMENRQLPCRPANRQMGQQLPPNIVRRCLGNNCGAFCCANRNQNQNQCCCSGSSNFDGGCCSKFCNFSGCSPSETCGGCGQQQPVRNLPLPPMFQSPQPMIDQTDIQNFKIKVGRDQCIQYECPNNNQVTPPFMNNCYFSNCSCTDSTQCQCDVGGNYNNIGTKNCQTETETFINPGIGNRLNASTDYWRLPHSTEIQQQQQQQEQQWNPGRTFQSNYEYGNRIMNGMVGERSPGQQYFGPSSPPEAFYRQTQVDFNVAPKRASESESGSNPLAAPPYGEDSPFIGTSGQIQIPAMQGHNGNGSLFNNENPAPPQQMQFRQSLAQAEAGSVFHDHNSSNESFNGFNTAQYDFQFQSSLNVVNPNLNGPNTIPNGNNSFSRTVPNNNITGLNPSKRNTRPSDCNTRQNEHKMCPTGHNINLNPNRNNIQPNDYNTGQNGYNSTRPSMYETNPSRNDTLTNAFNMSQVGQDQNEYNTRQIDYNTNQNSKRNVSSWNHERLNNNNIDPNGLNGSVQSTGKPSFALQQSEQPQMQQATIKDYITQFFEAQGQQFPFSNENKNCNTFASVKLTQNVNADNDSDSASKEPTAKNKEDCSEECECDDHTNHNRKDVECGSQANVSRRSKRRSCSRSRLRSKSRRRAKPKSKRSSCKCPKCPSIQETEFCARLVPCVPINSNNVCVVQRQLYSYLMEGFQDQMARNFLRRKQEFIQDQLNNNNNEDNINDKNEIVVTATKFDNTFENIKRILANSYNSSGNHTENENAENSNSYNSNGNHTENQNVENSKCNQPQTSTELEMAENSISDSDGTFSENQNLLHGEVQTNISQEHLQDNDIEEKE